MKTISLAFFYLVLAMWNIQGGNLLKNGDFEQLNSSNFPADWYIFDEGHGTYKDHNILFQSEPNVVRNGSRSASMLHGAPEYSRWVMLRQDITKFKPGKYILTGYVRWNGRSMARPCITLHLIDTNGGLSHPLAFQIWNKPTATDWVPFRYEFTVSPKIRVIGINIIATDGPAQVYVDNVGLWPADEAPAIGKTVPEKPPVIPGSTGHKPLSGLAQTKRTALAEVGGIWYLKNPQGDTFWDIGMNHCSYPLKNSWWDSLAPRRGKEVRERFPKIDDWADYAADNLRKWGYTSLGAWSHPDIKKAADAKGLYFWVALGMSDMGSRKYYLRNASSVIPIGGTSRMADPFDPEWRDAVRKRVREIVATLGNTGSVVGYFPDNEISMGVVPLYGYIASPGAAKAWSDWLSRKYKEIRALNQAWNTRYENFDEIVASPPDYYTLSTKIPAMQKDLERFEDFMVETYVDFVIAVIREADPGALIASPRLPGERLCGYSPLRHFKKFDLIAVNSYGSTQYRNSQLENLRNIHRITGRPILITEWTVGASDRNHGGVAASQKERAEIYETMLRQLTNEPYIVGAHYQMWFSPEAIGGNQFGVVDNGENPFPDFNAAIGPFQCEINHKSGKN